jgi:hypothetical protein
MRKLSAILMRDSEYTRCTATSEFDGNIQEWLHCVAWNQYQSIIITGIIGIGLWRHKETDKLKMY